jgi:hypothetical protein
MPNTLVHLGIQGFAAKVAKPTIDLKWVFLGATIPDVPWILQRALSLVPIHIDPYSLRLYCIAQASLFMCLWLCAAISIVTERPGAVFTILGINCVLHLILDACQQKWANGVHLFVPFSWELTHFDILWPEHILTYLLTGVGLAFAAYVAWSAPRGSIGFRQNGGNRLLNSWALFVLLFAAYLTVPAVLLDEPRRKDNHYVDTLQNRADRSGKRIELDRVHFVSRPYGIEVSNFAGEKLRVITSEREVSGTVSVRGYFIDVDTIKANYLHYHTTGAREIASYIGLFLLCLVWVRAFMPGILPRRPR